ncbi:unnamed protein product [Prunus armeniaca]
MYVGERILRASLEGDAKWLDVLLLVIIKNAFGKGPRSWLCPEGLVVALLLALQAPDFLEEKPHCRVGMRESLGCWRSGVWVAMGWVEFFGRLGVIRLVVF